MCVTNISILYFANYAKFKHCVFLAVRGNDHYGYDVYEVLYFRWTMALDESRE